MTPRDRYGLSHDPIILHCPRPQRRPTNPFHATWERAVEGYLADETLRGAYSDPENLTIVTYNTRPEESLLERGLRHLGLGRLVVLGAGLQGWTWRAKIELVHDYLGRGECPTDYVACLDADDILVVDDPALILPRFLATGSDMLFCNTRGDQPPSPECSAFEDSVQEYADPKHRHLNAGGYVAKKGFLADRLAEILRAADAGEPWCFSAHGFDDQLAWRNLHREGYPRIRVDAGCRVFLRFDEDR